MRALFSQVILDTFITSKTSDCIVEAVARASFSRGLDYRDALEELGWTQALAVNWCAFCVFPAKILKLHNILNLNQTFFINIIAITNLCSTIQKYSLVEYQCTPCWVFLSHALATRATATRHILHQSNSRLAVGIAQGEQFGGSASIISHVLITWRGARSHQQDTHKRCNNSSHKMPQCSTRDDATDIAQRNHNTARTTFSESNTAL